MGKLNKVVQLPADNLPVMFSLNSPPSERYVFKDSRDVVCSLYTDVLAHQQCSVEIAAPFSCRTSLNVRFWLDLVRVQHNRGKEEEMHKDPFGFLISDAVEWGFPHTILIHNSSHLFSSS